MNQQDFGLRLKELRKAHGITQSQLSDKLGISRQAYVNYETGRTFPPTDVVAKLSQIYGIDLMEILYNHTTLTYTQSQCIMIAPHREDFFSMLESYSKLSPLSKKRIINLISLLSKGGDEH